MHQPNFRSLQWVVFSICTYRKSGAQKVLLGTYLLKVWVKWMFDLCPQTSSSSLIGHKHKEPEICGVPEVQNETFYKTNLQNKKIKNFMKILL